MRKFFSLLLLFLFLLPMAFADGMIIRPDDYIVERGQLAFIDYDESSRLQRMVLGIQVDNVHEQKAAWIFPVPSNPGDVAIDVLPSLPTYYGREVKSFARSMVDDLVRGAISYEVWPVFFYLSRVVYDVGIAQTAESSDAVSIETGQSVVVYDHIEKYGVTTELVGAKDGAAIRLYLVNKGLEVPFEANNVLRSYADQDYTFVVSWLNEPEYPYAEPPYYDGVSPEFGMPYYYPYRQLGVQVMFKTDKAYYPLLPTSVYGSEKVPATIYVKGYVTPSVPENIKPFVKTSYMKTGYSYPMPLYDSAYPYSETPNEYTVVSITDAPSKFLTDDLWFSQEAPSDVGYASSFVDNFSRYQGQKVFVAVLLLSLLLGSLLGFIIFRDQWWKLSLVSAANCFSVVGLAVALFFVRTRSVDANLKNKIREAGLLTVSRDFSRKLVFLVSFTILFVVVVWLVGALLKIPLN